jgi:hypothetical protein
MRILCAVLRAEKGRPYVSEAKVDSKVEAKWTWQNAGPPPPPRKPGMSMRTKALIQLAVMAIFGSWLYFGRHHVIMPSIIAVLAVLTFVGAFFYPPLFHGFEKFGAMLAKGVAVGLTWGLLVPFFYIVFVPAHLILTLTGNDPMTRKVPTDAKTYWIPRPPLRNMEQYKKQH